MDDNSVAAFAIFCIFGLPIAAWILFRIFRFVERMAMISRGIVPPSDGRGSRQYRDWVRGSQTGPVPGQVPWQGQPYVAPVSQPQAAWAPGYDDDAQSALFKGIRLALIGFAILIGLSFIGGTPGTSSFHGGPWLLGGLIPMFVGIAQIIIALLSGAQLPGSQRPMYGPPPGPSAPPPAPPPSSGAWEQPRGPRLEELSKPVQPPDLR